MKKLFLIGILWIGTLVSSSGQSLDDYIAEAVENNPGLKSKYREYEASMTRIPQVSSLPDPEMSIAAFGQMVETRVGQQMARISLSQMFPWFGTLGAMKTASTAQAEATFMSYLDAKNELIFNVRSAYYPLYELEEKIVIQNKNLLILQGLKNLATIKFENGITSLSDALRVELMMNDAKTEIKILNEMRKPLAVVFNRLLNRDATESIIISKSFDSMDSITLEKSQEILINNPKVSELDKRIEAAKAQETVANKSSFPKLGVGFEYNFIAERTDVSIPENGKDAYMPMITFSLPVNRKKYRAATQESQMMQSSYREMQTNVVNNIESTFAMVVFDVERAKQQLELYQKQKAQTQQIINLLFSSYSNMGDDFEELLRMQQELLKYENMEITTLTEFQTAIAKLKFLTNQ